MSEFKFRKQTKSSLRKFITEVCDTYGLGDYTDCGLYESFSKDNLWINTDKGKVVVRFAYETRSPDSFMLEYEVVNTLDAQGMLVSPLMKSVSGEIVEKTMVFGQVRSYAVYRFLAGEVFRFGGITPELLEKAIETIVALKTMLFDLSSATKIDSVSEPIRLLKYLNETQFDNLLENNFQSMDENSIKKLNSWWLSRKDMLFELQEFLDFSPETLIHGDLNPSNFVFNSGTYGLIDFEKVGYAYRGWDTVIAIGGWMADQRVMDNDQFYITFRQIYREKDPDNLWDDNQIILMLMCYYLTHVMVGLEEIDMEKLKFGKTVRQQLFYEGIEALLRIDALYENRNSFDSAS